MSNRDRPIEDHQRAVRERWHAQMRREFDPWNLPPHFPRPEDRMVAAMEYAAFQLGEINQKLGQLMALTERVGDDHR